MSVERDHFPDNPENTPIKTVEVDDEWGIKIGLTSKVFVPMSKRSDNYPYGTQLYRKGDCMYIQAVEIWKPERHKDHFNNRVKALWDIGFTVKVPNPANKMYETLKRKGFAEICEQEPEPESLPPSLQVVMVKEPPAKNLQSS